MTEYILLRFLILAAMIVIFCGVSVFIYSINIRNKYVKRKEYDQRFNQGERKGWKW